jgi:hypothetical protein
MPGVAEQQVIPGVREIHDPMPVGSRRRVYRK